MVDTLSPDLQASIESSWQAIEALPEEQAARVRRALGLWCVAREPLPLSTVARLIDLLADGEGGLMETTRSFLSETPATLPESEALLGPSSEAIRAFVLDKIGSVEVIAQHRALSAWPPARRNHRRYVLKHGIHHRVEAGAWPDVERLGFDPAYLIAQCRELGLETAQAGIALARDRLENKAVEKLGADLQATNDPEKAAQLVKDFAQSKGNKEVARWKALSSAMGLDVASLVESPSSFLSLLYSRMRDTGLESEEIIRLMGLPKGRPRLRLEHPFQAPPGHDKAINSCAMTPDGARAVSASDDATLKVWDLKTGTLLFTLQGHTGPVSSGAITPDGRTIVSGSTDGTVRLWELPAAPSEQPIASRIVSLAEADSRVFGVQLTPDGKSVLSGARYFERRAGWIQLSSLDATPDALPSFLWDNDLTDPDVVATSVFTMTPDGQKLIVGLDDGSLFMKDMSDPSPTQIPLGTLGAAVTAVVVTPDGRRIITGSSDGRLAIWDVLSHERLAMLEGHITAVTACAVTPDGRRLISLGDEALRVWDLDTYSCLESCPGTFAFQGLAIGQGRVAAGDRLGNVIMFELSEPAAPGSGNVRATGPVARRCAILVGSSDYSDPNLGKLPYGTNDARELGRVLDERGYDVIALHDAQQESFLAPTREHILTELSLLHLEPNDLLLVYFSCHGIQVNGKTYLLTRECDWKRPAETGLPLAEVIAKMAASGARRQVLLLDACYAGVGLFGREGGGPRVNLSELGPEPVEPREPAATPADPAYLRDNFELAEGFALLAASTAAEKSHDRTTQPHALFTSLVIEGLSGAADRDSKGFVTVDDLKKHVLAGVLALVRSETGLRQNPTARIEGKGDMVLARVLPGQGPTITRSSSSSATAAASVPPAPPPPRPA